MATDDLYEQYDGDWMHVPEFARLLGVTPVTLRYYNRTGRVPRAGRDPLNGCLRWPTPVALAFVNARREREQAGRIGRHGSALDVHALIAEVNDITDRLLPDDDIAEVLGVSERTVYRHRAGRCNCNV
jgi:hypothetical protein